MGRYSKRLKLFFALLLFWIMLSESLEFNSLLVGTILSYLIVALTWKPLKSEGIFSWADHNPFKRAFYAMVFIPVFFYSIMTSAIEVARLALSPSMEISPGVIKFKSKLKGKFSLVVLSSYITLTPGTLTLDIDAPNRILFVHCLNVNSPAVQPDIKIVESWLEMVLE